MFFIVFHHCSMIFIDFSIVTIAFHSFHIEFQCFSLLFELFSQLFIVFSMIFKTNRDVFEHDMTGFTLPRRMCRAVFECGLIILCNSFPNAVQSGTYAILVKAVQTLRVGRGLCACAIAESGAA